MRGHECHGILSNDGLTHGKSHDHVVLSQTHPFIQGELEFRELDDNGTSVRAPGSGINLSSKPMRDPLSHFHQGKSSERAFYSLSLGFGSGLDYASINRSIERQ